MADTARMLKCKATGAAFPYRGYGRPPLYCPAEAKRRKAATRSKAQKNHRQKKAA